MCVCAGESSGEPLMRERVEERGATLPSAHRAASNNSAVRKVYETDIIWQNLKRGEAGPSDK